MNGDAPVVVDTAALYALASASDRYNSVARPVFAELLASSRPLWVTSYVLVEFGAITHSRLGFRVLEQFYDSIEGVFDVAWIDQSTHEECWRELAGREGRGLSLVDWSSVIIARHLNASIFTFDPGFSREGAAVIPQALA